MKAQTTTVDSEEIARFSAIASEWWNPDGKFKPLHRMNPCRISYIRDQAAKHFGQNLSGLSLLDIGCGGGLIAEPMARLGASVTAIDAGEQNIAVAKQHAEQSGLAIDYRCTTAEELAATGATYDIITALEIIEHVADIELFIKTSAQLVKPGGLIFYSTLNRTAKSYAMAILGAEYIMRLLPIGTHDWKKFLRPHELVNPLQRNGIELVEMTGMVMNPLNFEWHLSARDLAVNYFVVGSKAKI